MKNLLAFAAIVAVIVTVKYSYYKGLGDGEQYYKQSHRMYMALKSAYHFGYMDAKDGRCESWEGDCK